MPRKKLSLDAYQKKIEQLKTVLSIGTPITIACSMVGISLTTYYYWVAIYSIVVDAREQEELEQIEKMGQAGVSINEIKELAQTMTVGHKKSSIGMYIEPKQESILQYKNSTRFRKFADQCYEVIKECNEIRSRVVVNHLNNIVKSTDSKNRIKASGSMWFLERTQTDYFGRTQDKVMEEENTPNVVPKVEVEFIDPGKDHNRDRISEMEQKVLQELKGTGEA